MKKLTAILLTLSLMLTMLCTPALAGNETSTTLYSTAILGQTGKSGRDWMSNDTSRAALAALLTTEFLLAFGDPSPLYTAIVDGIAEDAVYVGLDGNNDLHVLYFLPEQFLYVIYSPMDDTMGVSLLGLGDQQTPASVMNALKGSGLVNRYSAVSQADILTFMFKLQSMLE